jgi:hypothetical protein
MEHDELTLFEADCSECGQRYVGSPISARPDLCHSCFLDTVTPSRKRQNDG